MQTKKTHFTPHFTPFYPPFYPLPILLGQINGEKNSLKCCKSRYGIHMNLNYTNPDDSYSQQLDIDRFINYLVKILPEMMNI